METHSLVPLHLGRTFTCYRDVNKAIDQHRELFGLKLTLKKSVKLDNYQLSENQVKSVNPRLKYGLLDYNCTIDNGRVGRPGNDERCDLGISLRLSEDASELVVSQSHIHEYNAKGGFGKAVIMPTLPGMTLSPIPGPALAPSGTSSTQPLAPFGSMDPAVLAASLAAVAAAAAGPNALLPQTPTLLRQPGSSNLTSATPSQCFSGMPSPLSSTPMSSSITVKSLSKCSSTLAGITVPSPLPGQLLIPSFYASKSPSGSVTYNSLGNRNSSLMNNSGRHSSSVGKLTNASSSNTKTLNLTPANQSTLTSVAPGNRLPGQEKLTMKFKKSQFSPNEMVVVGSARDALEQKDCRAVEKVSSKPQARKGSSGGGRINAVVANLLEKVVSNSNNSLSVTHVLAPVTAPNKPKSQSLVSEQHRSQTSCASKVVSEAAGTVVVAGRVVPAGITLTPASAAAASSSTSSGTSSQSQPTVTVTGKQATNDTATVNASMKETVDPYSLKRLQEKIRAKKAEKAAFKVKIKTKPLSYLHGGKPTRPVGRPLGSTNSNRVSTKINSTSEGRVLKLMNGGREQLHGDGKRKIRKCRQRSSGPESYLKQQRSFFDNPDKLLPIDDTELGECAKTRFAQRVMLQLLRTTTRLPMVEFSHAMDTIVTLTDALRLKHRVELSVRNMESADDGSFTLLGSAIDDDLSVSQKRRRMLQQLPLGDMEGAYSDVNGTEGVLRNEEGSQDQVTVSDTCDEGTNARSNSPKEVIDLDGVDENSVQQKDSTVSRADSTGDKRKLSDEPREDKTTSKRSKD